jgi:DNA polymerase
MEQATRDLYLELLRLKASGTQSIYVDSKSIQALLAARTQQNQQCGEGDSTQSEKLGIKKSLETNLSHTVKLTTEKKQRQPINIQLPKGSRPEQLLWLEKQYFNNFNTLQPKSYLFGSGSEQAEILVCRYQGEVESEKSQQRALLSKVFKAMELERHSIYITHLIKYLPNEDPIAEIALKKNIVLDEHRAYLVAQIECIRPKILLALGKASHDVLLGHDTENTFAKNRGQWRYFNKIPMITSYDPNYLLHNDTLETKRQFWEDMLKILIKLDRPISNKQSNYFLPRTKG